MFLCLYPGCRQCHSGQAGPGEAHWEPPGGDCLPQEDPRRGLLICLFDLKYVSISASTTSSVCFTKYVSRIVCTVHYHITPLCTAVRKHYLRLCRHATLQRDQIFHTPTDDKTYLSCKCRCISTFSLYTTMQAVWKQSKCNNCRRYVGALSPKVIKGQNRDTCLHSLCALPSVYHLCLGFDVSEMLNWHLV